MSVSITLAPKLGLRQRTLSYLVPQTIETVDSIVNGLISIKVVNAKPQVVVSGAIQAGGIANTRIKTVLNKITNRYPSFTPQTLLILGFGVGNFAVESKKIWPALNIVGIDNDQTMVSLGFKYFNITPLKAAIQITDAASWLKQNHKTFDFIYCDLFHGFTIPPFTQEKTFHRCVNRALNRGGIAIFNYFTNEDHQNDLNQFLKSCQNVYDTVEVVPVLYNQVVIVTPGK